MPRLIGAAPASRMRRATRSPQHTFHVRHPPYVVQPFLIAPVLPGETLKNLSLQSRAISKPLKSDIIGWWLEHYVFYVKHRDIDYYYENRTLEEMAINGGSLTSHADYITAVADTFYYRPSASTGMDWTRACLKVVMANFFRDEGEAWDAITIDSQPAAYLRGTTMWDSAILESDMDTAEDVTINVTDPDDTGVSSTDTLSVRDVLTAMETYQLLVEQNLVNVSYEDWLRSYGVRTQRAVQHKPELIRMSTSWSYPSVHVVPDATVAGDSDVTGAVSWSIQERADKDRYFSEPGFIFGVSLCRPKVYLGSQKAPGVQLLNDARSWLPAILLDNPRASWKKVTDAAADILAGGATGDFWLDLRDLFMYGDQYLNQLLDGTVTDINRMASTPGADLGVRAPVQASVDALFVSGDATGGIKQDGIVRLHIASVLRDTSPRGVSVAAL